MSKRTASDIYTEVDSDPSSSTSQPPSMHNINTTDARHFISQTFLGPICTRCNTKVARHGILFHISCKSIIRHWTKEKCYEGNMSHLNAKELERTLSISINNIHISMNRNPSLGAKIVNDHLCNVQSTKQSPFCSRCGYVGKQSNLTRHLKSSFASCTVDHLHYSDGLILLDKYNFAVPQELLNQMSIGSFILPIDRHLCTSITITPDTSDETVSTLSSQTASQSSKSCHSSHFSTPFRFLPTRDDVLAICSPDSTFDDSLSSDAFAFSELADAFGDDVSALKAHEYLTSFIHLIQRKCPGHLGRTLVSYTKMMNTITTDPNLELFLNAGKSWLISGSANMDVRLVPVHHRNLIYLVGHSYTDADKDLHKGCTFSWVEKSKDYAPIF